MSDVLFIVAPYWAQGPASVHRDPEEAIRAAAPISDGSRVLVVNPVTGEWKETEAPHLIDLDDPHHVQKRLTQALRELGDDLVAGN